MVFILAASSLHHALETLTIEEKTRYNSKVFSIPGLSLNPNTKNLLSKDLAEKNDFVIWHDDLKNTISRHDSNNFCSLSVPELIEVLKGFQDKLCALGYWRRYRNPKNFEQLKVLEGDLHVKVFIIVKDFISQKKT